MFTVDNKFGDLFINRNGDLVMFKHTETNKHGYIFWFDVICLCANDWLVRSYNSDGVDVDFGNIQQPHWSDIIRPFDKTRAEDIDAFNRFYKMCKLASKYKFNTTERHLAMTKNILYTLDIKRLNFK